jgi:type II secretory pathway pseudopilin PulG
VLSIIVLLIAILVPAAILAERDAYSSATQADLAAIGQALSVYHTDFNMYPNSDVCYGTTNLYPKAPNGGILSGHADDYLAECLLGYLPGEFDGAPSDSTLGVNGYSGGNISQCAGFAMQPYKKVYGPYMPVNAQNITPDGTGNYYFSGDFPPTAGTPLPILYFSATPSPSSDYVFGATPGQGIFCSGDDPGGAPSGSVPPTTGTPPLPNPASLFLKLIGDKTGTNSASGGAIMGRNSYLLVAPGPSQVEFAGDSLVYGGQ